VTGYLRRNDQGQDLAEYCLITAVIALIGLGLFIHISGGLQNLWGAANSTIAAGSSNQGVASDSATRSQSDGSGHGDHGDNGNGGSSGNH
jgi:Flp pilus assembly pilin Flp